MKITHQLKLLTLILVASFGMAAVTAIPKASASDQNQTIPTINYQQRPTTKVVHHVHHNFQPRINRHRNRSLVGRNDLIRNHPFHLKRAKAAVALDGRTGQVVYQKHANQKRLVASTGKLMTLYLARKKLAQHPRAWNHRVTISHAIVRMGHDSSLDGFRFAPGHRYSIRQLFKQAFVASDDNSAIRLGQWVGGSNRNFVRMMNHQARKWHLNAKFTSASGLENDDLARYGFWVKGGYHSGNLISAKSLAIIAYHLIKDYPSIMKYSKIKDIHMDGQNLHNYNNLLPGRKYYQHHLHVDGLKTGYTPAAGYCFVGTGKRPGRDRLITVVLHDPTEFSDTEELMNHVYRDSKLFR